MITSNNNNLCVKYYITLSYVVSERKGKFRQFNCPSYAKELYTT